MKTLLLNYVFVVFGSAVLLGQDAKPPKPATQDPLPEPSPAEPFEIPSSLATPAPQLIPPDTLPLPDRAASPAPGTSVFTIPQLDQGFKASPVNAAADAVRWQIAWRELRNQVAKDADLRAKLQLAERAPTDLSRRNFLRAYYEAYFGRIIDRASTPELKTYLKDRKTEALAALAQRRVRPETAPPAERKR